MAKKYLVQGNYQYSEANFKDANALRSFGWLIGRKTEHQNKKGEKVFTIRRDTEIGNDPAVKKAEAQYLKYNGKAQKKMTRRHRWGQFFAILFTIIGAAAFAVFMFADKLPAIIGDVVKTVDDIVKPLINDNGLPAILGDWYFAVFALIAVISLISIFVNNGRYKKRMVLPKRKYCKKYIAIVRNSLAAASERVYNLKLNNRALMTKNDKKLADLGTTMERVMDRTTADDYE